jgi:succinylglutamic semialdehyde dehydrogenase
VAEVDSGAWIGGVWVPGGGARLASHDPARYSEVVWEGRAATVAQVDAAVAAASQAAPVWGALDPDARVERLMALAQVTARRADELARAITLEMGKPYRESLAEAKSLPGKIAASVEAMRRLPDLALSGAPGRVVWRPHGVVAVIGPYNYPAHLVHTHVAPALLAGNAVVIKPSEITPWSLQVYASMLEELELPPGTVNLVQGRGEVGAALAAHPGVGAVAFTGSWATGRRILEACLDQPGKLLALEMGGRNPAVVLDDAHIGQAIHELVIGTCLTGGQRCTATSRALVHEALYDRFVERLVAAFARVFPGDPWQDETLFGPMATQGALDVLRSRLQRFEAGGVRALLAATAPGGGAFVTPSIHAVDSGAPAAAEYVATELFAPDLAVERVASDDEAIARARASAYGLSLSVFTARRDRFERFVREVPSGIFNWNRSTNNASGLLPFGGLGRSGNFHPAGSAAALYCAHPIAVLEKPWGEYEPDARYGPLLGELLRD